MQSYLTLVEASRNSAGRIIIAMVEGGLLDYNNSNYPKQYWVCNSMVEFVESLPDDIKAVTYGPIEPIRYQVNTSIENLFDID